MDAKCTACFKNLGIESRFKIFEFIKTNKEVCEADITAYIKLKQPTVSYHLNAMQLSGLINKNPSGKKVLISINKNCPHDGTKCIVKEKC